MALAGAHGQLVAHIGARLRAQRQRQADGDGEGSEPIASPAATHGATDGASGDSGDQQPLWGALEQLRAALAESASSQ